MGRATRTKSTRHGSYKKIILNLLKDKFETSSRQGVSRNAMYFHISNKYELKDESVMRKCVSKRVKELLEENMIAPLKAHPQSFKLTKKGRNSLSKKKAAKSARVARTARSSSGLSTGTAPRRISNLSSSKSDRKITSTGPNLIWEFSPMMKSKFGSLEGGGLFVNDKNVFMSISNNLFVLDRTNGNVVKKFNFPRTVNCVIGDHGWLYCGLDNGEIYDCTTEVPRQMYSPSEKQKAILWLDIYDGFICADASGDCIFMNLEGEEIWKHHKVDSSTNRFVRTDGEYVFHAANDNVTAYRFMTGEAVWTTHGGNCITFGNMDEDHIYTAPFEVRGLCKRTGEMKSQYFGNIPWAVATNYRQVEGEPNEIYSSDTLKYIYCYDKVTRAIKWIVTTNSGKGVSMEYDKGLLFCVTERGTVLCYDTKEIVEQKNIHSNVTIGRDTGVRFVAPNETVSTTNSRSNGILVQVIHDGSKLRVRPDPSETGFNTSLNVQFPRSLRREGAKYVVSELVLNNAGTFYRARGEIQEYIE